MTGLLSSLPLHPMLVHFPIALFVMALVSEGLSLVFPAKGGSASGGKNEDLHQTAVHLYVFAVMMAPLAVLSGLWEEQRLGLHHPVLTSHKNFGLITMWLGLISMGVLGWIQHKRRELFRKFFIIIIFVLVCLVVITAFYGGRMVYEYGVGIPE